MRIDGRILLFLPALLVLAPRGYCDQPLETSAEAALWAEITGLAQDPPATQPYEQWFSTAAARREQLLGGLRRYQVLYPGGAYAFEAVQLELATLYEVGTLAGGDLKRLQKRVAEYLAQYPAEHAIAAEAAYWQILCARLGRRPADAAAPTSRPAAELLDCYRDYVRQHPRAERVPMMLAALFADALARNARDDMRQWVVVARQNFSEHRITAMLAGRLRRVEAVGEPFWLSAELAASAAGPATQPAEAPRPEGGTTSPARVDTRDFIGSPVIVVVWSALDAESRRRVREVEDFRRGHGEVRVVGVNVNMSAERMREACSELGVGWPQVHDGLGRATAFAREWGIETVPVVFVIDRAGRLLCAVEDGSWREKVEEN